MTLPIEEVRTRDLKSWLGPEDQDLKVANGTPVQALATAIVKYTEEGKYVYLSCIGVQAVAQAAKAVAAANGQTAPNGYVFLLLPWFHVAMIPAEGMKDGPLVERTMVRFTVVRHRLGT